MCNEDGRSNTPPNTHAPCSSHSVRFFSPSSSLVLVPSAPLMYGFFLQWLFQSAARDVINFIHTLWMLCLGKKSRGDDVRRERRREREQPRGGGVAEEDFQCSCMYNE